MRRFLRGEGRGWEGRGGEGRGGEGRGGEGRGLIETQVLWQWGCVNGGVSMGVCQWGVSMGVCQWGCVNGGVSMGCIPHPGGGPGVVVDVV